MPARYHAIHTLASGGMADVYLGVQTSPLGFRRLVAIKKIKPEFARDEDFLAMFRDEANVCQYLQHSNVVQIVDFTALEDTVAIVLEFIPGANLLEFLSVHRTQGKHIPVPAVAEIFCEILKGLAYVHDRINPSTGEPLGIIHRDLTPTNVIISAEGEVKLTDFGIAKARANQHLTQAGMMKGKLNYVSPEQFDGLPIDPRTDIYSAGLLLWEMLTGKRLYGAKSEPELIKLLTNHNVQRNPKLIRPDLDDDICTIAMTAIAIDREQRYRSAAELLKIMRGYQRDHTSEDFDLAQYVKTVLSKSLHENRTLVQDVFAKAKHFESVQPDDSDRGGSIDLPAYAGQNCRPMSVQPKISQLPQPHSLQPIKIPQPIRSTTSSRRLGPHYPTRKQASHGTPPIFLYAQVFFMAVTLLLLIFRHDLRELLKVTLSALK